METGAVLRLLTMTLTMTMTNDKDIVNVNDIKRLLWALAVALAKRND